MNSRKKQTLNRTQSTAWRRLTAIIHLLTIALVMGFAGDSVAARLPDPYNRVAIIIDASGSYQSRQHQGLAQAVALLDAMAQTKLHRWEPATDQICIISLDALPDVLWEGTLRELKAMDVTSWRARFEARTDYASCTDVSAAFRLAVSRLSGDPRYVRKYLFVFSDLIHQPPTTTISTCSKPSAVPHGDFPWEALKEVSVSVFWLPPSQKYAWRRAVEARSLEANFALYTTSESATVKVFPPPRPEVVFTEAEREQIRGQTIRFASAVAKGVGLLVVLIGGVMVLGFILQSRARRKPAKVPKGVRRGRASAARNRGHHGGGNIGR